MRLVTFVDFHGKRDNVLAGQLDLFCSERKTWLKNTTFAFTI